jgi:N-glycosylase/DNA lyase
MLYVYDMQALTSFRAAYDTRAHMCCINNHLQARNIRTLKTEVVNRASRCVVTPKVLVKIRLRRIKNKLDYYY